MSRELRKATSLSDIERAAVLLPQRLRSTGVYKDVRLFGQPALDSTGAPMRGALDIAIELDESLYSVNTGVFRTMDGRVETGFHASLLNPTGRGEKISVETGAATGEFNFGALTDVRVRLIQRVRCAFVWKGRFYVHCRCLPLLEILQSLLGGVASAAPVAAGARRAIESTTPTWAINYAQPTIGAWHDDSIWRHGISQTDPSTSQITPSV